MNDMKMYKEVPEYIYQEETNPWSEMTDDEVTSGMEEKAIAVKWSDANKSKDERPEVECELVIKEMESTDVEQTSEIVETEVAAGHSAGRTICYERFVELLQASGDDDAAVMMIE